MFNPASILKFSKDWKEFEERHPKFALFVKTVMMTGVNTGSVIDISITLPDGKKLESNMKITDEDVEFLKSISELGK